MPILGAVNSTQEQWELMKEREKKKLGELQLDPLASH